jgi:PiT family inorganic phosphate transporter
VIISKVLLPALVAPVVAGIASLVATRAAYRITDHTAKHSENVFRLGQRLSASMVALAHGTSDGQKTMGLITLVLVAARYQDSGGADGTRPHEWVIALAGAAMALGTYSGGWRIMRTMGKRLVDIQPPQGFASESAATVAILASSHLGFALSTTHVCSGAIIGSGVGGRAQVNWSIARRMLYAWLLTLPAAAIVGALASLLTRLGLGGFIAVLVLLAGSALAILISANRNKIDHRNVNDHESEQATPTRRLRRFGPGPDRPVTVIDGISWTNARGRVSGDIRMTAHAESGDGAPNAAGPPTMITIMSDDRDDDEDAPDLASHIVPDGR